MFETLNIKRCYRTKKDNLKEDFFIPLLANATVYDRGTGFFTIDSLVELSNGIIPYIKKGGNIRVITSIELGINEIEIINRGYEISENEINEKLEKIIELSIENEENSLSLDLITNLIAANRLQVRIAYLPNGGIYHEKVGYFCDEHNNSIWFTGSNNETYSGIQKNVESFIVLKSWQGDRNDINEQKEYFESLWRNEEEGLSVIDFPTAAKNKLFSKFRKSSTLEDVISIIENNYNISGNVKKLYPYQQNAINEFVNNKYCHFFEMATGTGKTYTAVKAIEKLSLDMNGKSLYVVVVVPQIDLQDQWKREFKEIGIKTYCFGGHSTGKNWEIELSNSIIDYHNGEKIVVSICIYDTYFSKVYKEIEPKKMNKIIIVDEAHELSANQIAKLSDSYKFRLGLSATPERHNKYETDSILNYFTKGNIESFKYTIDEAIKNNFLSEYLYYPITVYLENSDVEFLQYQKYTIRLAQLLSEKEPEWDKIQEVCNNRSLIVKKATNKLYKLNEIILENKYDFKNSVVYCGQGKDLETEESIIDNVSKIIANIGQYKVSQFTSKTIDRQLVLKEFEKGYYDTLIAIKCFDQGVDVPKLDKIYIMASDTLSRQTIQRRGRVLRKCKETGKQIAYIYDMVVLPPKGCEYEVGASSLVAKELKRIKEYGRLANNYDEVELYINELIMNYNITEESDDEKEIDY